MPEIADLPKQKCPACGVLVEVAEAEPLAKVTCPACGEKFRVERAFDNFALVETLGVGGMGSVYKARDTRLERFVALKLLRKELSADPAEAARLEHEARVTAAVNHPNVVQVYSAGSAHGQIYLVMELVDHGSLDDLMAQHKRVPEAQVLQAGIQVAKGLQAAQAKGLIHRDVKPANILFSDAKTAKIGDFGLAGVAEQKVATSEIWGTPYYVAPERLDNAPEDFRSDIYSLGATLFHALAGKPPMEGETTSAAELRQLKSHPPDLHTVAPDISRETTRIINRMLAPEPANRFTSYQHVVEQLVGAYRALLSESAGGGGKSKRWLAIAAALVVLALIGGGAFYYIRAKHAAAPAAVQTQAPAPALPDNLPALQKQFDDGRRLLVDGKYPQAGSAFSKGATEAGSKRALGVWLRMNAGLAALLEGKVAPAREIFDSIQRAGPFATGKADGDLAKFFVDTSAALAPTSPVRPSAVPNLNPKTADAFALLLYGMKDWQLNEFDEAAGFLDRFARSEPPNELSWINDYKPLAQKFLEDHAMYVESKKLPQHPATPDELRVTLATVKGLRGKLQIGGPMAAFFSVEEKRLSGELARREKAEKEAQEKVHQQLLASETPAWQAARENAQKKIAVYDFTGAAALIDAAKVTEPSLVEARAAEQKRISWLRDWKTKLTSDLQTGAYKEAVTLGATTYQGAAGANATDILLRVGAYGGAPFKWDRFAPPVLLKMANTFIRPNTPDTADRQWLSATFAHATGQTEAAKTLSEAAANAKPAYRDQFPLLAPAH